MVFPMGSWCSLWGPMGSLRSYGVAMPSGVTLLPMGPYGVTVCPMGSLQVVEALWGHSAPYGVVKALWCHSVPYGVTVFPMGSQCSLWGL